MSRRRAGEDGTSVASNDAPQLLPTTSPDAMNGKQRTPAERVARVLRTRPVSSLLLVVALSVLALVTFWLGRTVGRTLSHMLYPHTSSKSSTASTQISSQHQNPASFDSAHELQHANPPADKQAPPSNASAHSANDDAWLPPAFDERGDLVDGAADPGVPAHPDQPPGKPSSARPRVCYRKFEPGKLGYDKTLCVTDEYYFDISIGETPVGRFKVGVFGEVVPKSAANFRSLVTCSGVFADDTLCYRGDTFHRVVTNFVAQGGSKATGRSIYGATFREEKATDHHSFLEHGEKGVISWAEYPIGSQFFILIRNEAKYLDDNHVVFGIITDGLEVIDKIHDAPRNGEEPSSRVKITDCGDAHPTKPK